MINEEQKNELDKLFQVNILDNYNGRSILGGSADLVHHFIPKANGLALRWYIPNGVPLTHKQHVEIHQDKGKLYEEMIIDRKGKDWYEDLQKQNNKIVHNVNFEKVKSHLEGNRDNYA